jgi:hypothetical protein
VFCAGFVVQKSSSCGVNRKKQQIMILGRTLERQNVSSGADSFAPVGRGGRVFPVGQSSRGRISPFSVPRSSHAAARRHVAIKLGAHHRHQRRREFSMSRSGGGLSPPKAASKRDRIHYCTGFSSHQAKLAPFACSPAFVKDLCFHVPRLPPAGAVQPGALRLVVGSFSPGWTRSG